MPTTVKSLEERMDGFEQSFYSFRESMADFRGRVDVVLSMLRWVSGLLVVTIISIIFHGFSISNSAGRLEGRVDAQGARLDTLTKQIEKLTDVVEKQQRDIAQIRADIAELKVLVKQK